MSRTREGLSRTKGADAADRGPNRFRRRGSVVGHFPAQEAKLESLF
jgi:hypothetical protein